MRIAIILMEDFPGSDNRVQRQCRTLVGAGHRVTVFCATGSSQQAEWEGVRIQRSPVRRIKAGSLARRLYDYIAFPLSARRWLNKSGDAFDLVQVANPPDWLVFAATAWRRDKPGRRIILDLHEPMPELMEAKTSDGIASRLLRRLQGASCRAADRVLVVTEEFRAQVALRHSIEPVLVRNAVDTRSFPLTEPSLSRLADSPLRVVYAGTVAQRFGVDLLVEAVLRLAQRGVDVQLDVYGDGDGMQDVRTLAERGGDFVRLHGQVPSAMLASETRDAAVGVVPYRDSAFMRLAESTKAYEYAVLGMAIVCSDLPALRAQLGEDNALYVRPGDPNALADALDDIAEHPTEALRRAEGAHRQAMGADWHSVEHVYLAALDCEVTS